MDSSSHSVALLSSCRNSWLLSRLSSRCPLTLSSRCHLIFSPCLSLSSQCTALSLSDCAGWLLLPCHSLCCRLLFLSRRTLVLSSSSHCATLLSSHRTVWLLCRLSSSSRCRLVLFVVLSLRHHLVVLRWLACCVASCCATLVLSSRCPLVLSLCPG